MATEPDDQTLLVGEEINLYAPQLPDAKDDVADADYGIAIRFYDEKPRGAKVIVPALLGQQPNMTVFLNLNGVEKITSEQTENATSPTTLHIPHNLLRADRLNTLNYTVQRLDSPDETYEPPVTIKYNKIRPGIEDENNGDEGHSRLHLILPQDVIEDGVDADRAAQGVQAYCQYPYCRPFDKISLHCNGHVITHVVHPDEAPPTPTDEPTAIGIRLDQAFFEAAGDSLQSVFYFTVEDELTNGADPTSPWSKPIRVVIDLKGTRLAAPNLAEDPNDPHDDPDTIDWNKLGARDLTVEVHVFDPVWKINDKVKVKYTATPSTGSVVEHETEVTVTRLPFTQPLMIPNAKVIADSRVKVLYEQVRGGVVTATSKNARALVIQKPVITSIKNSFNKELVSGGTVSDNKVMLSGSALKGLVLQILVGGAVKDEVTVGTDYKWQSKFISIAV
ncbi:Ig-like domain-containing protein, partial [Pseudomonas sp. SDO52101_S400]